MSSTADTPVARFTRNLTLVPPRWLYFAVFTVSGFSGLIYESIWAHYLKLFLGHAAYAQSLVLIIFMGGMAIGSWAASGLSQKWKTPILIYAAVEAVVGILALGFHGVFTGLIEGFYATVLPQLGSPALGSALKFGAASLLILPQSILLGMTFPLMSAGIIRRYPDTPGGSIAMLYFTNSIGAALGVLASGFWLIGAIGLPGTIFTAGLLNLLLALFVFVLVRLDPDAATSPIESTAPAVAGAPKFSRLFLAAAFITGLASFIYEIAWIRMLSLVLGATTHSFELMLSAFITGLAFGGLWIRRRIDTIARPVAFAGYVQILMALAAVLTLPVYYASFEWMGTLLTALDDNDAGYAAFTFGSQLISLLVMLPATFLAGMTLPLFTYVLMRQESGERAIGRIYAANTFGAIVGVLFAVHVGLPLLGLEHLIVVGALLDLVLGVVLLRRAFGMERPARVFAGAMAALAAIGLVSFSIQLDPALLSSGVYRHANLQAALDTEVLFYRDGKTASISMSRSGDTLTIRTNGKPDAGIYVGDSTRVEMDEPTMMLAAALPLAYNPDAVTAGVIGFGSGLTTHTLLADPRLEVVDTVEIEPMMVEGARGFGERVARAYDDPRSHIYIEDAKTYFSLHDKRYDLIVAEPSNPWVSGVSSLFSHEFYRTIGRYLEPDGIFVQWLQLYEFEDRLAFSVLKALAANFDDFAIYNSNHLDILIVARREGALGEPDFTRVLEGQLGAELSKVGVRSEHDFHVRKTGSKPIVEAMFRRFPVPANSDYYPFLDTNAGRARYLQKNVTLIYEWATAALPVLEMLHDSRLRYDLTARSEHFYRLDAIDGAESIYGVITGDTAGIASEAMANNVYLAAETVRRLHTGCALAEQPVTWELAWRAVAGRTLPYLDPERAERLVRHGLDAECIEAASREQQEWIALYTAVARRDAVAMAATGTAALGSVDPADLEMASYALTAGMLGYVAQDRPREAYLLWREHAPGLFERGVVPPYTMLVAQVAITRAAAAREPVAAASD